MLRENNTKVKEQHKSDSFIVHKETKSDLIALLTGEREKLHSIQQEKKSEEK